MSVARVGDSCSARQKGSVLDTRGLLVEATYQGMGA